MPPPPAYEQRVLQYMQKAAREAKLRTRWTQPDAHYEAALEALRARNFSDRSAGTCLADIQRLADRLSWFGAWNGLTLTLLKYTSPGVPDLYQGSELVELSLVDPDNRRPVDYELRMKRLDELRAMADEPDLPARLRSLAEAPHDGSAKLWFMWRLLSMRREHEELFREGSYEGWRSKGRWRGMWWLLRGGTKGGCWWWWRGGCSSVFLHRRVRRMAPLRRCPMRQGGTARRCAFPKALVPWRWRTC
jgi:(1->4)-alpha-D-glucan 1-alpha-D-glucosylmutase